MKIALVQTNPTIGAFNLNVSKIEKACRKYAAADLIVFPELALSGYYPQDLLESAEFLTAQDRAYEEVVQISARTGAALAFGCALRNTGPGKPLFNALVLMKNGKKILSYAKRLLPTYNIFDERRHFEPGVHSATWDSGGERVGFVICEDGWNDDGSGIYKENPIQDAVDAGATLIVSINASPAHVGKPQSRLDRFAHLSKQRNVPLIYVNQVGGNDSIMFDGHSFVMDDQGTCQALLQGFEEDDLCVEIEKGTVLPSRKERLPASPSEFFERQIVMGLRDYSEKTKGFPGGVVVGSSGGIDSALTIALAVKALGADKVLAVTMPSKYSSEGSVSDSVTLCKNLGVELLTHPIKTLFDEYVSGYQKAFSGQMTPLAQENIQARIRGAILMEVSNTQNRLLLSTGNKSETSVGYCTLYGDTNGGLNLIGDLYKMEVFELSRYINQAAGRELIPVAIIDKPPSAELAPGQKDDDSLPVYPILDALLRLKLEPIANIVEELGTDGFAQLEALAATAAPEVVQKVTRLLRIAEFKRRQAPPIVRVHAKAFGIGRQMPIAAQY